ncbi:Uncharacterized protein APZ42_018728 [Daphnia magna]|uniref:Uncharacterized protein n=1 Tax=Daphnia magna TaxID=35525 RepID=A0A162CGC8_9CRUS|nr:Uncharacterized protein APZ42_018728 [Daphnia magna]
MCPATVLRTRERSLPFFFFVAFSSFIIGHHYEEVERWQPERFIGGSRIVF